MELLSLVCPSPLGQMLPGESTRPAKPIIMHDCGAQTELHPVESNIDRSYEWNEWQLRKKAIKLVRHSDRVYT